MCGSLRCAIARRRVSIHGGGLGASVGLVRKDYHFYYAFFLLATLVLFEASATTVGRLPRSNFFSSTKEITKDMRAFKTSVCACFFPP